MIIRILEPDVTAEFMDDDGNVICVVNDTPQHVIVTSDDDTGRLSAPFVSEGCTIAEHERERVVFESVLREVDGSPCGAVRTSVHAPMVGVVLSRIGIGVSL